MAAGRCCQKRVSALIFPCRQVQQTLHEVGVLFKDRGILHATDSLTVKTKTFLASRPLFPFHDGREEKVCAVPVGSSRDLKATCMEINTLICTFFETHFPHYEEINAFSALCLEKVASWDERRSLLRTVAQLEKMNVDALWPLGFYISPPKERTFKGVFKKTQTA